MVAGDLAAACIIASGPQQTTCTDSGVNRLARVFGQNLVQQVGDQSVMAGDPSSVAKRTLTPTASKSCTPAIRSRD